MSLNYRPTHNRFNRNRCQTGSEDEATLCPGFSGVQPNRTVLKLDHWQSFYSQIPVMFFYCFETLF